MQEEIKNVPPYAKNHRYWVYREVDGERWFWGAWDDSRGAIEAATNIRGYVYDTKAKES